MQCTTMILFGRWETMTDMVSWVCIVQLPCCAVAQTAVAVVKMNFKLRIERFEASSFSCIAQQQKAAASQICSKLPRATRTSGLWHAEVKFHTCGCGCGFLGCSPIWWKLFLLLFYFLDVIFFAFLETPLDSVSFLETLQSGQSLAS